MAGVRESTLDDGGGAGLHYDDIVQNVSAFFVSTSYHQRAVPELLREDNALRQALLGERKPLGQSVRHLTRCPVHD